MCPCSRATPTFMTQRSSCQVAVGHIHGVSEVDGFATCVSGSHGHLMMRHWLLQRHLLHLLQSQRPRWNAGKEASGGGQKLKVLLTGEKMYRHTDAVGAEAEDDETGGDEAEDGDWHSLAEAPHGDGSAWPVVRLNWMDTVRTPGKLKPFDHHTWLPHCGVIVKFSHFNNELTQI